MDQRIDRISNRNTAILVLLARSSTRVTAPAVKPSAERSQLRDQ